MHTHRLGVLWLVLILLAPIAGAQDFFEDVMNQNIINEVSELPYSTLNPDIVWQKKNHISAWVDFVGFENLSKDGETYYILGDPASLGIIRYDAKAKVPGSVTKIEKSISTYQDHNYTIVTLSVNLYWKSVSCDKNSCWEVPHHEQASFQDSAITPKQFTMPGNQSVTLKRYNGSVYHPKVLSFDLSPVITQIHVTTDTDVTLSHYLKSGIVGFTEKNVPYLNLSKINMWGQTGSGNISSLRDEVVTDENISSITFMTPYGSVGANITEKVMPETVIYPGIFGIIFVVLVIFSGINYMRRFLK